jgi:hypothetical protein
MGKRLKGGLKLCMRRCYPKLNETLQKRLMQVVNFLEDRSPSGKVDMSCSRVAALHYVEDCIDGHIRDTVGVD